jgi:hypothetical protein
MHSHHLNPKLETDMTPPLDIGVDARDGDRVLTKAIYEACLPSTASIRGYLRDLDYEKYGFAFLDNEECASSFMSSLYEMDCSKHFTAQSHFENFVRPGGLLDFLKGKASKRDMVIKALSIARRTHCRFHETGSFKLTKPNT